MPATDDGQATLPAPRPGEEVLVDARQFAGWAARALSALTCVRRDPSGLRAILDRVVEHEHATVRVGSSRRFMRIGERWVDCHPGSCGPRDIVMVEIPELEGLRAFVREAGMSDAAAVGVPRGAITLTEADPVRRGVTLRSAGAGGWRHELSSAEQSAARRRLTTQVKSACRDLAVTDEMLDIKQVREFSPRSRRCAELTGRIVEHVAPAALAFHAAHGDRWVDLDAMSEILRERIGLTLAREAHDRERITDLNLERRIDVTCRLGLSPRSDDRHPLSD